MNPKVCDQLNFQTDTASVLHEAIEYIKFLHDQVNVCFTSDLIFH